MVLDDITQLGKDSGLHSFEQVGGCACVWVGVGGCVTRLFNQECYNWQMWCLKIMLNEEMVGRGLQVLL